MKLNISKDLPLPKETATQKLAWLGTTGSGKTYGASKLAEEFWEQGAQFVVLDPVGVWYGLRLGKDGRHPSDINIPIFGGLHGDVPLESTGGELLANLVVDKGLSCIIDVSQFESDTEKARFAKDFANKFFFRKKVSPSAVHLFLEEVQEFVPQNPQRGEEQMLHAFVRMQKLGRNFGIGSSYITQRPQEVNKKALNMAQTLFVFRNTGTHERAAIEKWIEDKSLDQSIAQDLPKLGTGTCHIWSPEFLKVSKTIHISEKKTFNASATPEVGAKAKARQLAPIDLEKVRTEMAATIEKAKQEDPKLLREEIARLKKQAPPPADETAIRARVQRAVDLEVANRDRAWKVYVRDITDTLSALQRNFSATGNWLAKLAEIKPPTFSDGIKIMDKAHPGVKPTPDGMPLQLARHDPGFAKRTEARFVPSPENVEIVGDGAALKEGARKMLHMLQVRYPDRLKRSQLGTLVGFKASGGTFRTYISALRSQGLIDEQGDTLGLTEAGQSYETNEELPGSPEDRQAMWRGRLKEGARKMFDEIIAAHPGSITRQELGERLNVSAAGGTFRTYISTMKSAGLITVEGDVLRASDNLF